MRLKHDIICVGLFSWQNDYTRSTMQLIAELAKQNRVLFINYAYSLNDVWQHLRGRKRIPLRQILGLANRLNRHTLTNGGTVDVLIPPVVLPINALRPGWLYQKMLRWNTRRILRSTRQAMQQRQITSPIVLNALHPTLGVGLAGRLDETALVYYCYDAIEAERWSRWHGPPAEEQMLRLADAVVTTSQGLYAAKRLIQPACYLVENGADVDVFRQANVPRLHRQSKTVGYLGAIDNRLDFDLLERCFRAFADTRFLFVGRVPDPAITQRMNQFANVTLAGPQPPADLPNWVAQMDVGLIPFVKNEQTRAIYPMKINEYLAAGLPVISTDFADLRAFDSIAAVCSGADRFVAALGMALTETDPNLPNQRLAFAQANSWKSRGRQLTGILEEILTHKTAVRR